MEGGILIITNDRGSGEYELITVGERMGVRRGGVVVGEGERGQNDLSQVRAIQRRQTSHLSIEFTPSFPWQRLVISSSVAHCFPFQYCTVT